MYMNAITVNYAEVGDDYLPISFGLGSKISFVGKTVYNSTITEILDTSCIILQGRDIGTTNIIVSSSSAVNRCLSDFTPGSTSWIEHIIPNTGKNTTTYIFYKSSDGYYYKMVENDQGKPVQEKYALYARILSAADNKNKYPYCEAKIETPVPLEISNGKVNAIINSSPVEIARTDYSLVVELENADGTPIRQTITENEYSIDTKIYDLNGINWTRDGQKVMSWLSDNKIVKSSMSTNGWTKTIKLLAGNNIVTIPRNKSTITVNFTFTNTAMSSFEWGGAYHNGFNDSTMSGNALTIPDVRQGSSIDLTTFYTDSETSWFKPFSIIDPLPGSGTFSVEVSIPTPSVTDTIKFTGWIDGKLEQGKSIPCNHGILPQAYTIDKMNTEVSTVDITNEIIAISDLLTYDLTNKQFKRHRQITQINKSSTSTWTTTIADNKNPETTSTDIYLYASNNNVPQTFNVTAHYTKIPAVVSVTNPSATAVASNNQVVLFENTYYVADTNMKSLVESLVSGVAVTAQKEIVRNVAWKTTILQKYYKMNTTKDGISVTYTSKFANITISGIGSKVTSVESSDSNLTAQLTNQALSGTDISITIHYTVPDGYSLLNTGHQPSLDAQFTIPASDWNKTVTYKFFN